MKYKYRLKDLDCANCAHKIEEYLNNDEKLNNVCVNFANLTLSFETDLKTDINEYVSKKIQQVEPEVSILDYNETEIESSVIFDIVILIISFIFALFGILTNYGLISKVAIIIAYIILLYEIVIEAIKLLIKTKQIDEHFLITISCVGAYFIGSIEEGLAVIFLYRIGEILEHLAVNHSRKSIASLMDIKPEYANLKKNNEILKVEPSTVNINDIIVIKKGEKVPLDGIVTNGQTSLNTIALTGESKLRNITINDEVLSGSINVGDIIELKVTNTYENSTVSRILNLVENATDRKAKTENFVSKAAKIYTPIIVILAICILITFPTILKFSFSSSLYRALSFLVISCPCAIAISVPLSYFSGLGVASKHGILIKGSDYLDSLKDVNKIIFDKTGTLTTGQFTDFNLIIIDKTYKKEEIINLFVKGESLSNHPLALSIVNYFNKKIDTNDIKNFKEISGKGLSFEYDNNKILIGSYVLVNAQTNDNSIYLKVNDNIIAKLEMIDSIKNNVYETIETLNAMHIKAMMFTGDNKETALNLAKKLNIKSVKYELLPENKYFLLEDEINSNTKNNKIVFIGDGINDAPSLARSDIGISMGNIGSASAIEASDIVITNDDISKIIDAINISKKTNKIIKQNLLFAILTKVLILILSILGISSMWHAVFADTGVTLLTILNTTRILKYTTKN